jgi:signal transduction histidine kinase
MGGAFPSLPERSAFPPAMLERFLARFGATVVLGETQRIERILATARAFLAVSSLVAIWLDPVEAARISGWAYGLLVIYVVHSLLILVLVQVRKESSAGFRLGVHAVDVLWPVLLSVLGTGPSSPFFTFSIFALLAAAYRWGFIETMATAGAAIVLYFSQVIFLESSHPAVQSLLESEFGANRFIMRGLYLLITGYLLGYLGEEQKRLRAESAAITRIVSRAQREVGLRASLRVVFEEILNLFGATRGLLALEEVSSGRVYLWKTTRDEKSREVGISNTELDSAGRGAYFFESPGATWHALRLASPRRGNSYQLYVVSENGTRLSDVSWSPPEALQAAEPFGSILAMSVNVGNEWTGHLLLIDPQAGTAEMAVPFLQTIVRQVSPVLYSVFLMRRLRSRVGAVERARVARELHDGVIQSLIGLEMQVDVLRRQPAITGKTAEEMNRIQELLRKEVLNLREVMQQMKPLDLGPRKLLDFLALTVDKFRRDTGIAAHFISPLEEVAVSPRVATEVGRIVQEALANVRKHSDARAVFVRFESQDGFWRLVIYDDGRGFGFSGRLSHAELDAGRQGPLVIRERVRSIGGELSVESGPGKGARLEITFPQRAHG